MKKLLTLFLMLPLSIYTYSQGQNWKLSGNTLSFGDYLGSNNNEPVIFKANGNEALRIKPNGDLRIKNFDDNLYTGLVFVNTNGVLSKLNFTGNANEVLLGNGTFSNISLTSGWSFAGGIASTTGNVVIGNISSTEKLNVDGNILANGSISGTSLNVVDIVGAGKEFKILNSLCLKGQDVNVPGSRNMICGMNGDLYVQSTNNNYNTIINYGNVGKVGIGVIPTEDFHVGLITRFDKDVYTDKIYTNRITSTDSIISIGDSTLRFNWAGQNIFGDINQVNVKGLGLGVSASGSGKWSTALGYRVKSSGEGSIVIGSGNVNGSFWNTIPYSLAIGFNSTIPTLFVSSSNGPGTFGNVGIGTNLPMDRFQIGSDYTSVSFGRADVGDLQWGTSYLGFNATRTSTGWIVKTDGAANGGGVIYSTLNGKMIFSTIPNTGANAKSLTDNEILSNRIMVLHPGGGVSIGTDCLPGPDFGLVVKGKMISEEITVKLADNSGCWPDFVFDDNFVRLNWKDKSEYIRLNKHLPNIQAADSIEKNGIHLGNTLSGITQNIEENTLDIIDLYRKLERLEEENIKLKKELEYLRKED